MRRASRARPRCAPSRTRAPRRRPPSSSTPRGAAAAPRARSAAGARSSVSTRSSSACATRAYSGDVAADGSSRDLPRPGSSPPRSGSGSRARATAASRSTSLRVLALATRGARRRAPRARRAPPPPRSSAARRSGTTTREEAVRASPMPHASATIIAAGSAITASSRIVAPKIDRVTEERDLDAPPAAARVAESRGCDPRRRADTGHRGGESA